MLEFPHPYNLLCAHLFPGLACCNGLPSRVGFPSSGYAGIPWEGEWCWKQSLSLVLPPPCFLFGSFFQLSEVCATSLCRGISMRQISLSQFGCLKRAEMLGKKLCWFSLPPAARFWWLVTCLGHSSASVTCDPVSGNLDWRKAGFAHHSRGDASWGKWNSNNTWIY